MSGPPLTVEEMWQIVQNNRGFQSSPSGAVDRTRLTPATLPPGVQAGDKGNPVGKGFETFACVQVVDSEGNRVAVGADFFDHGGPDHHAEARALRGMERISTDKVPGGKIIVVVDQDVCPACEARLRAYGERLGASSIDIHLPERPFINNPARMASPKTTARTSFVNFNKPTQIRLRHARTIALSGVAGVHPTTSVATGTIAKLGSGMKLGMTAAGATSSALGVAGTATGDYRYKEAADLLQPRMLVKWAMLQSLKNMPQPKPDPREAESYFTDPDAAAGMRTLDLLAMHLRPFGQELAQHHTRIRAIAMMEIMSASMMAPGKRLELLDSLGDQLTLYIDDLYIVLANLEAAQELKPQALAAAKSAEDLVKVSDRALVQDWLLKQGFEYNEMIQMFMKLSDFASVVRTAFRNVDALHDQVERQLADLHGDASKVNTLYWSTFLEPLVKADQGPPKSTGMTSDEQRVLRALPGASTAGRGRMGLSPEEIYQIVRKDGVDFIPSVRSVTAALHELEQRGLVSSMSGASVRRGGEYWRSTQGDLYLKTHPAR
jgi:hypothetical protein